MANIIRRPEGTMGVLPDPFRMMQDLLRWDPFREMAQLAVPEDRGFTFVPSFDVKETKDSYVFKADLPGVKEEELDISLTGNRLTITGKREMEERTEGERYYTYERSYGSFTRSFTLPDGVDADQVKAELRDGVLTLVLPKKPEHQPRKITLGERIQGALGKEKGAKA